ncbi:hypothetical protein BH23ACT3_BH23ACT3_11680 [soil metagenome]
MKQIKQVKQVKQVKQITAETPDLVKSAMALQQAQADAANAAMAAALDASTSQRQSVAAGGTLDTGDLIAGVSLAEYAAVSRTATDRGITDPAGFVVVAGEHGIAMR